MDFIIASLWLNSKHIEVSDLKLYSDGIDILVHNAG